jgi:hypothetical protein
MKTLRLLPLCLLLLPTLGSAQSPGQPTASPEQLAADQAATEQAIAGLQPERKGVVDAYVVVVALDSDPVFNREAREAGRVLARRFDAAGRTLVLAGDEGSDKGNAPGTPSDLALALRRIAQIMDRQEDVLVLYSTSHGVPDRGLVFKDAARGTALIGPGVLGEILNSLGLKNRLLILQACYSGQFAPVFENPGTIVVTAAAADRSSFGCQAGNDWTYFGDALVNHAFRQPLPLDIQLRRARALIAAAEERDHLFASNPQVVIGSETSAWLDQLEAREPKSASEPVGQSALRLGK